MSDHSKNLKNDVSGPQERSLKFFAKSKFLKKKLFFQDFAIAGQPSFKVVVYWNNFQSHITSPRAYGCPLSRECSARCPQEGASNTLMRFVGIQRYGKEECYRLFLCAVQSQ